MGRVRSSRQTVSGVFSYEKLLHHTRLHARWSGRASRVLAVSGARRGKIRWIADTGDRRGTGIHNRGRVVSVWGLTSLTTVHMCTHVHMWLPTELVAYPGDPEHFI